ncbi:hypothetical protein RMSM_05771 [Rhodopirellula maiorica SM1]|uniref:Uncharacterized protein n=1 Tax=Rhodopirellula maiorica SM1 TaxID=1265738 RepID=M5RTM8_9BACT|nr:hypothetical protein [Rhodopirellula maiorica]EMI17299.1 hypothetical protein RMSM_05771 [Rhodopirellula maiorica SM1]
MSLQPLGGFAAFLPLQHAEVRIAAGTLRAMMHQHQGSPSRWGRRNRDPGWLVTMRVGTAIAPGKDERSKDSFLRFE